MTELATKELSVGYGQEPIVSDVAMEVRSGKIVTLIGPNGAGKSTILRTISGALAPVCGTVLLDGKEFRTISASERAKSISVMTTTRAQTEYATCFEVVAVGRFQFTGVMGRLSDDDKAIVEESLKRVGAYGLKDCEFSKLSDGQKQRVLLARALAQEPSILILDEPTSFLDVGYKLEFVAALKSLVRKRNIGVLASMHELELARDVSDLVVCVSDKGSIDRIGTPDEVFQPDYIERLFNIKRGEFVKTYGFMVEPKPAAPQTPAPPNQTGRKTKFIMVQGTMSGAGKSLIAAGLCRVFKQDGFRVAPFKSQNMALNSFVTDEGLEMGRAQVMQAEAAGVKPSVYMNPILLKPTDDCGSQVIVNGRVVGNMRAREYFAYKTSLVPEIERAIEKVSENADIVVIEGAGSPAEINLKKNDIVNMGMAKLVDAPVLLVADIDRGGVFAQLLGTLELLEPDERARVVGLIVNKFRGDKTILDPGVAELEKRGGAPVLGVVPYANLTLEDEDSMSERFTRRAKGLVDVAVVRFPHIANFTDFDVFEQIPEAAVRYIRAPREIDAPDLLILPGTKNTIADVKWLKETGIETMVKKAAANGTPIVGICGGYQALGVSIDDPLGVEVGGSIQGLGLLNVKTTLQEKKRREQVSGAFVDPSGALSALKGVKYRGYEIHMGETTPLDSATREFTSERSGYCRDNIYGTYVHGVFDDRAVVSGLVDALAKRKGVTIDLDAVVDYADLKEKEYDRWAQILRECVDVDSLYRIMGVKRE